MTFVDVVSYFEFARPCDICPLSVFDEETNCYHCGLPRFEYASFTCYELVVLFTFGEHLVHRLLRSSNQDDIMR